MNKYGAYRLMKELGEKLRVPATPDEKASEDETCETSRQPSAAAPAPKKRTPWAYRAAVRRHEEAKKASLSAEYEKRE